jgi:hypothetical protein
MRNTMESLRNRVRGISVWKYCSVEEYIHKEDWNEATIQYRITFHPDMLNYNIQLCHITDFLITEWKEEFINNNARSYLSSEHSLIYGFLFTRSKEGDKELCDGFRGWKRTGRNITNELECHYFQNKEPNYEGFKKRQYLYYSNDENMYRGIIIYFRSDESVPITPSLREHKNAKHGQPFQRMSKEERIYIKTQTAHSSESASKLEKKMGQAVTGLPKPRDSKQINNMKQQQRQPENEFEMIQRLATFHDDVIQHISFSPLKSAVFYTKDSLLALNNADIWVTDTTFNIGNGYATAIVFKNKHFSLPTGRIQCGCVYYHQVF